MKKTTKKQKQVTKANSLKFDWLQEHSHLKKLEEVLLCHTATLLLLSMKAYQPALGFLRSCIQNCTKELESLLLRMYNDACSDEPLSSATKRKGLSTKSSSPELLNPEQIEEESSNTNDNNDAPHDSKSSNRNNSPSSSSSVARDLEELIRMEQVHRVALLKQVTSEREQVCGNVFP